ncbi:LRR receptor-like serine/threonine-protein kinase fls2 [Datura stramonium]|uniref:LRR receptor-like serine/threonine-protein kinase fls2 n=1 Tax=Datura stramonium TaxID=4076 RepID=A0ABS8UQ24_DATST|nr:LRR receptor-like serine/threonine-protein kinase fls2 [Datura stramonium]
MDTIPSEYIRSENEQPAATTLHGVVLQVPVIDISEDANEEKIVELVAEASKEWGIFQVINHGIPDEVIGNLQKVGKEFFEEVPQEEKELIMKNPGSQSIEGEANEEYAKRLREVVDRIFKSLSLGLGLEAHEMMEHCWW